MSESERGTAPPGPGQPSGWAGLVYFWDGGWIGVGSGGVAAPHAHHAIQVTLGLDGPIRFREGEGDWADYTVALVQPDVLHAFDGRGTTVAMLFVDAEGRDGRWLRDAWPAGVARVPPERVTAQLAALRTFREERPGPAEAATLVTALVAGLCRGPRPVHQRDDRIARALELIHARTDARVSQAEIAAQVFLSPSRFAHLFTADVGVPFRRYLLWRKLSLAMQAFGRGATLSAAAHAAGFSDSAHLTRTWQQMFGLAPTMMTAGLEFFEIPAP